MKIDKIDVFNFDGAFRGLRNPMNSWDKSDSKVMSTGAIKYKLGPNDLKLAQAMIRGGTDESKFLRQIFVSMDIEAPLYW